MVRGKRWEPAPRGRRLLHFGMAVVLGMGAGIGLGVLTPAQSASALVPVAPLPVALSSELVAAFGATETAASAAGAAGVAATAATPLAAGGGIAVAGAGAFVVTAGAVGIVMRATGQDQDGLCAAGTFLGALYGADCSTTGTTSQIANPNSDIALSFTTPTVCNINGACFKFNGGEFTASNGSKYLLGDLTGFTAVTPPGRYNQEYQDSTGAGPDGAFYFYGSDNGKSSQSFGFYPRGSFFGTNDAPGPFANAGSADLGTTGRICVAGSQMDQASKDQLARCQGGSTADAGAFKRADPARVFETRATGSDGTVYKCQTRTFHEGDASLPQPCTAKLPDGVGLVTTQVVSLCPSGGCEIREVYKKDTTQAYKDAFAAYPECGAGSCTLQVYIGGQPCTVGASDCLDWRASKNAGKNVECHYGTHVVDLAECNVLGQYYQPAAQKAGKAYSKPDTGDAPAEKTSKPNDGGTAEPGGGTDPGDDGGTDCLGGAVTANPVTWVTGPVVCALQAAFVPSPTFVRDKGAEMDTAWRATMPAKTATAIAGLMPTEYPSGCSGLRIDLGPIFSRLPGGPDHKFIQVAPACDEPFKTIAAICNLGLVVVFGVGAALACSRHIGSLVNARGAGDGS